MDAKQLRELIMFAKANKFDFESWPVTIVVAVYVIMKRFSAHEIFTSSYCELAECLNWYGVCLPKEDAIKAASLAEQIVRDKFNTTEYVANTTTHVIDIPGVFVQNVGQSGLMKYYYYRATIYNSGEFTLQVYCDPDMVVLDESNTSVYVHKFPRSIVLCPRIMVVYSAIKPNHRSVSDRINEYVETTLSLVSWQTV